MKITFQGGEVHLEGVALIEGAKAPDFLGVKTDLSPYYLSDAGSTVKINGVTVITVSLDLPFAQARWCAAANANSHIVLSDYAERDFGKKFGTLIKELKLLTRAVFVLDKDNIVKYVQYVPEITNEPDYEAALNEAKSLL